MAASRLTSIKPGAISHCAARPGGGFSAAGGTAFELPDEALAETGSLQNEQHQQLYAALGKLKKEYRETLFLVYFEELSYRQAAQVLGRTEQQVTNLVYRGKQQLKQLLEQEGYQYEN